MVIPEVISKKMAITPLKSIRKGKSSCVLENSAEMLQDFKISGEMAKKNKLEVGNPLGKWVKFHCIRFVPFLEGGCQLQVHFS